MAIIRFVNLDLHVLDEVQDKLDEQHDLFDEKSGFKLKTPLPFPFQDAGKSSAL